LVWQHMASVELLEKPHFRRQGVVASVLLSAAAGLAAGSGAAGVGLAAGGSTSVLSELLLEAVAASAGLAAGSAAGRAAAGAGSADVHARLGTGLLCPRSLPWSSPSSESAFQRNRLAVEPRLLGGRAPLSELALPAAAGAAGCATAAGVAREESASPDMGAEAMTVGEMGSVWVPGGSSCGGGGVGVGGCLCACGWGWAGTLARWS